jgi:hypothetical protein
VAWVPWLVPPHQRHWQSPDAPQTLDQIRDRLTNLGLRSGDLIPLQVDGVKTGDALLPVLGQHSRCLPGGRLAEQVSYPYSPPASRISNNQPDCWQIVELRIYQQVGNDWQPQWRLRDRLAISGVTEFFAVSPLVQSGQDYPGTSRTLSLTDVQRIGGGNAPPGGDWLQIQGTIRRSGVRLRYGQVMRYDPRTQRLSLLGQWSSPAGQAAQWQQVTGDEIGELVVDQSLGLEPRFQVFQAIPPGSGSATSPPNQLQEIRLDSSIVDDSRYRQGIALAQVGLWSPALVKLEQVQQSGNWAAAAQAQRDLVALHARITRAQAERTWGTPSQKITAQLMDGRWAEALASFQAAQTEGHRLTTLLLDESGQLWRRIEAVLRINPRQHEVQAWGLLALAAQDDRRTAIAWLQQQLFGNSGQPATSASLAPPLRDAIVLLDRITPPESPSHTSRLLGTVSFMERVNAADWWPLGSPTIPDLPEGQGWYRVSLTGFSDGQRWQPAPFTSLNLATLDLAHHLRQRLGLRPNATVQLLVTHVTGDSHLTAAAVRAVQASGNSVQLLVTAPVLEPGAMVALAASPNTLHWLDGHARHLTLAQLRRQHPALATNLLPELQRLFGQPQPDPGDVEQQPETDSLGAMANWTVYLEDLNGNAASDVILVFEDRPASRNNTNATDSPDTPPQLANPETVAPKLRLLVFSERGEILYSNLQSGQGYDRVAIANLGSGAPPALLLSNGQTFTLRRWAASTDRLETDPLE